MPTFLEAEALGGKPREAYTFQRGVRVWRYVSSNKPLVASGITFVPASIKRDTFKRDDDSGATRTTIEVARSVPMAAALLHPHPVPLTVSIHRIHAGASSHATPFIGEAQTIATEAGSVKIVAATVEAAFQRLFPRMVVDRLCQNAIYDERCGVPFTEHAYETTVTAIDLTFGAQKISVADVNGNPDGTYNLGILRTADNEDLFITVHEGLDLSVLGIIPGSLTVGATVRIAPGCDKTLQMCQDRFANHSNHLGFPWLPEQNPMTGRIA